MFLVVRAPRCVLGARDEQVLDLEQIGPQAVGHSLSEVLVGKEAKLPARLIMVRVPDDVVEQRQARIRADAKRRGQGQANLQSPNPWNPAYINTRSYV